MGVLDKGVDKFEQGVKNIVLKPAKAIGKVVSAPFKGAWWLAGKIPGVRHIKNGIDTVARMGKNTVENVYNDKFKNAGFKSDIKNLISKFKAIIIDIVKNLHEGLMKETVKTGKKNIKENNRNRVRRNLGGRPSRAAKKDMQRSNMKVKDISKAPSGLVASKAIIKGGREATNRGLDNPVHGGR